MPGGNPAGPVMYVDRGPYNNILVTYSHPFLKTGATEPGRGVVQAVDLDYPLARIDHGTL